MRCLGHLMVSCSMAARSLEGADQIAPRIDHPVSSSTVSRDEPARSDPEPHQPSQYQHDNRRRGPSKGCPGDQCARRHWAVYRQSAVHDDSHLGVEALLVYATYHSWVWRQVCPNGGFCWRFYEKSSYHFFKELLDWFRGLFCLVSNRQQQKA